MKPVGTSVDVLALLLLCLRVSLLTEVIQYMWTDSQLVRANILCPGAQMKGETSMIHDY